MGIGHRIWQTVVVLTSFRIHVSALILGMGVGWAATLLGASETVSGYIMFAVYVPTVLGSAIGAAAGAATLNCPKCRRMVKMGSEVCHHCGNTDLTITPEEREAAKVAHREQREARKAAGQKKKERKAREQEKKARYQEHQEALLVEKEAERKAARRGKRNPETAADLRNVALAGGGTFLAALVFALALGGNTVVGLIALAGLLVASVGGACLLAYWFRTRG